MIAGCSIKRRLMKKEAADQSSDSGSDTAARLVQCVTAVYANARQFVTFSPVRMDVTVQTKFVKMVVSDDCSDRGSGVAVVRSPCYPRGCRWH